VGLLLLFFATAHPRESLKIMTYNIMGMKPGTQADVRLNQIIQDLKKIDPDIIGLQEINETLKGGGLDNQARVIAESLSAYFRIPYHCYYSQTHLSWDFQYPEFVGIITKHPVEQQNYSQLAAGMFPRKVVWNHILTPIGRINFFNTHLDGPPYDATIQQVQQILTFVAQCESSYPGIATILTGDLNNPPDSEPITLLKSNSFMDTWSLVNPKSPGYTAPSDLPAIKIDYILSKGRKLKTDSSMLVMKKPYQGLYLSDHLGVSAYFSLNPAAVPASQEGMNTFRLLQNYPNPFNTRTMLGYYLPVGGSVSLKVYNLIGEEVKILVNEEQNSGEHEFFFDADKCASGTYLYRIIIDQGILTRKMQLIK
jgi:endonuclease/exonuclease/phosphatase family metal-dependent hydrolase